MFKILALVLLVKDVTRISPHPAPQVLRMIRLVRLVKLYKTYEKGKSGPEQADEDLMQSRVG